MASGTSRTYGGNAGAGLEDHTAPEWHELKPAAHGLRGKTVSRTLRFFTSFKNSHCDRAEPVLK